MAAIDLKRKIRNIPDFPKKGIVFRDITPLLQDGVAFQHAIDLFYKRFKDREIERVVGIESRGFIFGGAAAARLGAGFVPVRKLGKLPAETVRKEYMLEYGFDSLEMHLDAIESGQRVLVMDDLLATGGTLAATCGLVEQVGGLVVGVAVLIELSFLKGRAKLKGYDLFSLIQYERE
jgi:adenine phosphoribosyltransferase